MYRTYLKIIAAMYTLAAGMRMMDVLDLRLHFSRMSTLSQAWTVYLFLSDLVAAVALWRPWKMGDLIFVLMVISQLAVFVAWSPYLGDQAFTITFHLITLTLFLILLTYRSRPAQENH